MLSHTKLSGCAFGVMILAAATAWAAEPWRAKLLRDWRALPEPPVTPYGGPFGEEARGFVGKLDRSSQDRKVRAALAGLFDWGRLGLYDPDKDPRPIDEALEAAMLEEWRRMGYNCAYKGNAFTFRVGRFLKKHGLLGAIDQTLWAGNSEPYLQYDGTPGRRAGGDGSGSFLLKKNYDAGVSLLVKYVRSFGDLDMFKVGDTYITCSWDEIGMRERTAPDYRDASIAEYVAFLRDVWFQDKSPAEDTNQDGRTYNAFTGEALRHWWEVRPPVLSHRFYASPEPVDEQWKRPGAYKLWMDYHRYYTFEYFRRVSEEASERLATEAYEREYKRAVAAGEALNANLLRQRATLRVDCYPFPQAFIMWPGMNVFWGYSLYWNHRQNAIINVEQCWPEHPAMAVNYAASDHLARKHGNLVMGWSWFFPRQFGQGHLYDGPGDIERALARMMGHTADGIHHWLYADEYRGPEEGPLRQRRQLAYWHNFLRHHYATFLAKSSPVRPEVALLLPDYTGYFYTMFQYNNQDFAWTAVGLAAAQIPFAIVTEEEIELEPDALKPFRAVYVIGSEWSTPTLRQRFTDYVAGGGTLCGNVDSLSLDITTGRRTDFLEKVCGARLTHKHKSPFKPSMQTPEERAWAAQVTLPQFQGTNVHETESKLWKREGGKWVPDADAWAKLDASLAGMPKTARGGIPQSVLDLRKPPLIRYADELGGGTAVSYGEVCTAEAVRGKPVAWFGDQVCGIETERTVWLGDRPGVSIHAIFPRMALSRAADKAGVKRLATLTRDGKLPCNLEVLPRMDADGTLMVVNDRATWKRGDHDDGSIPISGGRCRCGVGGVARARGGSRLRGDDEHPGRLPRRRAVRGRPAELRLGWPGRLRPAPPRGRVPLEASRARRLRAAVRLRRGGERQSAVPERRGHRGLGRRLRLSGLRSRRGRPGGAGHRQRRGSALRQRPVADPPDGREAPGPRQTQGRLGRHGGGRVRSQGDAQALRHRRGQERPGLGLRVRRHGLPSQPLSVAGRAVAQPPRRRLLRPVLPARQGDGPLRRRARPYPNSGMTARTSGCGSR